MHKEIPYTVLHNKDIPAKEVPTACATKEAPTATCTTKRYQQINILSHRHQSASLEVHLQRVSQGVRGVRRHHHRLVALVGHPNGEGRRARSLADTTLTAHRTTHATNQLDNKNIEQIIYTWYQVLRMFLNKQGERVHALSEEEGCERNSTITTAACLFSNAFIPTVLPAPVRGRQNRTNNGCGLQAPAAACLPH